MRKALLLFVGVAGFAALILWGGATTKACTSCSFFMTARSFQINLTSLSAIKKSLAKAKDFRCRDDWTHFELDTA